MKTSDGFEVTSRSYYFLLDWNESDDWQYIIKEFGKSKLKDLNLAEYKQLFLHATTSEMNDV